MRKSQSSSQDCSLSKAYLVPIAAAALITTTAVAPQAALADENASSDDTATISATETTVQEAASEDYTVTKTETVATYEETAQTFETEAEAQTYLDDAVVAYPADEGYTVETEGPTEVETGTTHTESTVVAEGTVKGYESADAAQAAAEDATAGYVDTDTTKYTTSVTTSLDGGTTTKTTEGTEVITAEKTFDSQEEAEAYVASLTAKGGKYEATDDVTYTIVPTYGSGTVQVIVTKRQKKGDEETTDYGPYDTLADAEAALAKEKEADPATELHEVTFSDITTGTATQTITKTYDTVKDRENALSADLKSLKADGWTTTFEKTANAEYTAQQSGQTSYTVPAGSWIGIKQAGKSLRGEERYYIWTEASSDSNVNTPVLAAIKASSDLSYDKLYPVSGLDKSINALFTVTKNDNGSYTLTPNDTSKVSYIDYGKLPDSFTYTINATNATKTVYSFTKTVQDYEIVPDTTTTQGANYQDAYSRNKAKADELAALEEQGIKATGEDTYYADVTWGGEVTKNDDGTYTIPANSWVVFKFSTGDYGIWSEGGWGNVTLKTPTTNTVIKNLALENDSDLTGSLKYTVAGLNIKSFSHLGGLKVTKNDDGSYTLTVTSTGKNGHIVGIDYGTMPTTQVYSYTITAPKTEAKNVVTLSYTVNETTEIPTYQADYTVTESKEVADTAWEAAYQVTKTSQYQVVTKADKKVTRAGWKAPHKSAAATQADASVPQTGDSTSNGAAGALAALGLGIAAVGVGSRRKAKHLRS